MNIASAQDFFFDLYLKLINVSPLGGILGDFVQKWTNLSILNLNNRRLVRLEVHFINQKKSCTGRGKPYKQIKFLGDQSF